MPDAGLTLLRKRTKHELMMHAAPFTLPSARQINAGHSHLELGQAVGLRVGRVHEVGGPAVDMFALAAASKRCGDIIWIGLRRDIETLNPAGLASYLDPSKMILVEAVSRGEVLWAADVALRAQGAFSVIVDMPDNVSLKESRRLQLAAEEGGSLGLILLRHPASTTAAQTRWQCEPIMGDRPTWDWHCVKGKNGEAGSWRATWPGGQNAKDTLHLAPAASP